MNISLNMGQKVILIVNNANCLLGCTRRTAASPVDGCWRPVCFSESKKLFKMMHCSKEKWVMMLVKCKKDSFATLHRPAKVPCCQSGGNTSVSAGRQNWAGMLAEASTQDVLLCVRHQSEHYTACWHGLNNSLPGWGSRGSHAGVQGASSNVSSASYRGHCSQHTGKAKVRVGLATQPVPFSVKMGVFWHCLLSFGLCLCFASTRRCFLWRAGILCHTMFPVLL